jgi:hypothetical protein
MHRSRPGASSLHTWRRRRACVLRPSRRCSFGGRGVALELRAHGR